MDEITRTPDDLRSSLFVEIGELAWSRNEIARLLSESIEIKKKIETLIESIPEYGELKIDLEKNSFALNMASQERANLEGQIKLLGGQLAKIDEGGVIPGGLTVKKFDTLEITDEFEFKLWAVKYIPSAVSVDQRAAIKAMEYLELRFAKVTKEPRVQIASDLSAYIPKPEETSETSQDTLPLILD